MAICCPPGTSRGFVGCFFLLMVILGRIGGVLDARLRCLVESMQSLEFGGDLPEQAGRGEPDEFGDLGPPLLWPGNPASE